MKNLSVLLLVGAGGVLAMTALYQLRDMGAPEQLAPAIHPLLPGDRFRVTLLDAREQPIADAPAACWAAFVIDPDCYACRELAERLAKTERQDEIYWIAAGRPSAVDSFRIRYAIPADRLLRIPRGHEGTSGLREAGVFATPTRLILDGALNVRDLRISGEIPQDPKQYCDAPLENG